MADLGTIGGGASLSQGSNPAGGSASALGQLGGGPGISVGASSPSTSPTTLTAAGGDASAPNGRAGGGAIRPPAWEDD